MTTHFLISLFEFSNGKFSRIGLYKPKQIALTGFLSFFSQCMVLPWVWVIVTCQPGINARPPMYPGLTPIYSIHWWFIAIIIMACYMVCLDTAKDFINLCISPIYEESLEFSNEFVRFKKKFISIVYVDKVIDYANVKNITVTNDRIYSQKYGGIIPTENEKIYPLEFRMKFICDKGVVLIIDTLFESEYKMLLEMIPERLREQVELLSLSNNFETFRR